VAAGSTITRDVPPGALVLGRALQVEKPGWAERKARERAAKQQKDQKRKG
jgi:bifunctional UDP-N-acetylglucosamine pyrophosphorylase/glucosamine-1-phosphate N-acetyltransferase